MSRILQALEQKSFRERIRSRPLRLRLLGWYGFSSTGDDLMAWCIRRLFEARAERLGRAVEWTEDDLCDLCVIGGGTIIGCDTSLICERAERIDAPLAIFGPGFRNTGEEECHRWQPRTRALFARAERAGVRGPRTAEVLAHYDMADGIEVIGDPGIWFEPIPIPWRPAGPLVGICVRNMRNAEIGLEERYASREATLEGLAAIVPAALDRLGAEPVFLSFAENEYDSDSEGAVMLRRLLPSRYQSAPILPYSDDVRLNPSIVGQLDYLISERMHPAIIAWLSGKPCILLENQYGKTIDFAASVGIEEYCIRTDALDVTSFMTTMERLLAKSEELAETTGQRFAALRTMQAEMVDDLLSRL